MKKNSKINILDYAKFQALIFALLGLLAGVIYSFGGFFIDLFVSLGWLISTETPGLSEGTVLAFGALLGMPLIAATFGFITGIVGATLYNLFVKWIGKEKF